jgi:hypothetical protein
VNAVGAALEAEAKTASESGLLAGPALRAAETLATAMLNASGNPPTQDSPAAEAALYDLLVGPALRAGTALLLSSREGNCTVSNLQTEGLVALNGQPRTQGVSRLRADMPYIGARIRERQLALGGPAGRLTIRDSAIGGIRPSEAAMRGADALMRNQGNASFGPLFASVILSGVTLRAETNAVFCGVLHLSSVEFQHDTPRDGSVTGLFGICRQGAMLGCQAEMPPGGGAIDMVFALGNPGAMVGADAATGLNGDGFTYYKY